jgi:hypothetical protein
LFEGFFDFSGRCPNVMRECDYRIFVFFVDGIFRDDNISVVTKIDVRKEVENLLRSERCMTDVKFGVIGVCDEKTIGGCVGKRHSILLFDKMILHSFKKNVHKKVSLDFNHL